MGKIRESMEKASCEATKKLFWDVKKLYTTGNVICINQNADEYKNLEEKSRESAAMPVFKEGLIVIYKDDRSPMKESRHYDFLIEELLNYLPDRQAAVSFAEDYVNIGYENLFLPFEAEIKEDGTIEYYIDVFISGYEKGLGKQKDVISTDTMVDLAEYTVCNGGKASPYGTYEAEKDGVTCSVVFAGSLNLRISPDKRMQVSGSNPAIIALKDKGYAETAEEAVQIAKENGFTLIHDSHDVVRSVFLSTMRMINYLIEHPEEKTLSKKRKSSESNGSKPATPKNPAKPEDVPKQKIFSLNSIQFKTTNSKTERTIKSRKWERVTDCWDVRGHYRHYKSGKTVYIAPYEKGADRNKGVKQGKMFKLE
jgi:hypothetical protein